MRRAAVAVALALLALPALAVDPSEILKDPALEARIASLTAREAEVARAVLAGRQNKQIAADLGISLKTVEIHRHNAMDKMGATSAADLVRLLVAAGWAEG